MQMDAVLDQKIQALNALLLEMDQRHHAVKFANSLGAEDMVLTHAIATLSLPIEIFLLNTGRLHAETLALIAQIKRVYRLEVQEYAPNAQAVSDYVQQFGLNAFYESIALRQQCCAIRKIEPLARALSDADAWVTGLRREQSMTRQHLAQQAFDERYQIEKYNPLADWSQQEVWQYLQFFEVPTNALHQKGYPSIGCEPCTRAIRQGEDLRAGRWWWEQRDTKECGLHVQTLHHA